ncbi:MAG: thioredoxin family protein [Pirellulaceae bacterium]
MKKLKLFHSVLCPRCHVSRMMLNRVLKDFPDFELEAIEFLTHRGEAKQHGVTMVPALICEGQSLHGIVFTPKKIRKFLSQL